MKISFFSNYLNEHQLPLCQAWESMDGIEFTFIALSQQGGNAGRRNMNNEFPFVLREYEGEELSRAALKHAIEDDLVIFGHMGGKEQYVRARVDKGGISFRSTERPLKKGYLWRFFPLKAARMHNWFTKYSNKNMYILCASAFAAGDLSLCGWPVSKCYRWGYFPDSGSFGLRGFSGCEPISILWASRFIDWKRPFAPLELAKSLKDRGYNFRMIVAGDGPLRNKMISFIKENKLSGTVSMPGMLSGEETKKLMLQSDIFLATSSCKEGWGATVNEAMGAGCAVVASASIGSAPFLVNDGNNGFLYDDLSDDDLMIKVCRLLDDRSLIENLGMAARRTIDSAWSAKIAANRLVMLAKSIQAGDDCPFASGPCSLSLSLENGWYHKKGDVVG